MKNQNNRWLDFTFVAFCLFLGIFAVGAALGLLALSFWRPIAIELLSSTGSSLIGFFGSLGDSLNPYVAFLAVILAWTALRKNSEEFRAGIDALDKQRDEMEKARAFERTLAVAKLCDEREQEARAANLKLAEMNAGKEPVATARFYMETHSRIVADRRETQFIFAMVSAAEAIIESLLEPESAKIFLESSFYQAFYSARSRKIEFQEWSNDEDASPDESQKWAANAAEYCSYMEKLKKALSVMGCEDPETTDNT